MKKIDLHIHTVKTPSDSDFIFSLENFITYVNEHKLDAVAITNHDYFDLEQYEFIKQKLPCKVFPGIEINLEKGHILLISDENHLEDFNIKSQKVNFKISQHHCISLNELKDIFGSLEKYLIIPHYEKDPAINGETLNSLLPYIEAGEVNSPKKFIKNFNDNSKLTPVLFSDTRIREDRTTYPTRQTYINCSDLSIDSIKHALRNRKVQLSLENGNKTWQVFQNGPIISNGLNILLGNRASGKTHTLDLIDKNVKRVKYIKQFSLIQGNEDDIFSKRIESKRSNFTENYLKELKITVDDILKVNLENNKTKVDRYCSTLIKSALEIDTKDVFSKCKIFDETEFEKDNLENLIDIINSTEKLLSNKEFEQTIEKHLGKTALKSLILELIQIYENRKSNELQKQQSNEIIRDIKAMLGIQTSATQVQDVDLYQILLDEEKVKKFNLICEAIKQEREIDREDFLGFNIVAKRKSYPNATSVKDNLKSKPSLQNAFKKYASPYDYIQEISTIENFDLSEVYKTLTNIEYSVYNKDKKPLSGGEKSEFRLLQEISDAQQFDMLLLDEPESSFDNIFLNNNVNQLIKSIAKTMPVIISTHNSTVGASTEADYILYASKEINSNGDLEFNIYSGLPNDKHLKSGKGNIIESHKVILNSLEAGQDAYELRRRNYENIKN